MTRGPIGRIYSSLQRAALTNRWNPLNSPTRGVTLELFVAAEKISDYTAVHSKRFPQWRECYCSIGLKSRLEIGEKDIKMLISSRDIMNLCDKSVKTDLFLNIIGWLYYRNIGFDLYLIPYKEKIGRFFFTEY